MQFCTNKHILIAVLLACSLFGQQAALADPFLCKEGGQLSSEKAAEVSNKLQSAYSAVEWFKARFFQRSYLAALDISEASSGSVWFHNPGEMKWHYEDPEEQIFILREKSLWLYQKEQQQVFIDELKTVVSSDLPVAFLMGIGDLKQSFSLLSGCQVEGGTALEFEPLSNKGGSSFKKLTLLVDEKSFLPIGAIVQDVSDNLNQFVFSDVKIPHDLSAEKIFALRWPETTDVIDRRKISG